MRPHQIPAPMWSNIVGMVKAAAKRHVFGQYAKVLLSPTPLPKTALGTAAGQRKPIHLGNHRWRLPGGDAKRDGRRHAPATATAWLCCKTRGHMMWPPLVSRLSKVVHRTNRGQPGEAHCYFCGGRQSGAGRQTDQEQRATAAQTDANSQSSSGRPGWHEQGRRWRRRHGTRNSTDGWRPPPVDVGRSQTQRRKAIKVRAATTPFGSSKTCRGCTKQPPTHATAVAARRAWRSAGTWCWRVTQ